MTAAARPLRGVVWLARVGALAVVAGALLGLLSVRADGLWLLGVVLALAGSGVWLFALAVLSGSRECARAPRAVSSTVRRGPWRSRPSGGGSR